MAGESAGPKFFQMLATDHRACYDDLPSPDGTGNLSVLGIPEWPRNRWKLRITS